jgi:hypothetical protein
MHTLTVHSVQDIDVGPVKTVRMGDDHVVVYRSIMIQTETGLVEISLFASNHQSQISIKDKQ